MEHRHALELIRAGVPAVGGRWADLGAGAGTFTRALAEQLGEGGVVLAVDRRTLPPARAADDGSARIVPVRGDFAGTLPQALEAAAPLDGLLMANALHFVRHRRRTLERLLALLRPGGHLLLVEYDVRTGSPWIPFPVPPEAFASLAAEIGLTPPVEIGRRRSRYGPRDLYAAHALLRPRG